MLSPTAVGSFVFSVSNIFELPIIAPLTADEERKRFAALMRKVEAMRLRYGMTKTELGANIEGVRAWMTGRTVGRKESVAKIQAFLKQDA